MPRRNIPNRGGAVALRAHPNTTATNADAHASAFVAEEQSEKTRPSKAKIAQLETTYETSRLISLTTLAIFCHIGPPLAGRDSGYCLDWRSAMWGA